MSWWLARSDRDAPRYLGAVIAINAFWFIGGGLGLFIGIVWAVRPSVMCAALTVQVIPTLRAFHRRALSTLLAWDRVAFARG